MCESSCGKCLTYHSRDIPGDIYCVEILPDVSDGDFLSANITRDIHDKCSVHCSNGKFVRGKKSRIVPNKMSDRPNGEFLRHYITGDIGRCSKGEFLREKVSRVVPDKMSVRSDGDISRRHISADI